MPEGGAVLEDLAAPGLHVEAHPGQAIELPVQKDRGVAASQFPERSRVPVLVGHHRRHGPTLAAAREVVVSGELGRVVAVQGSAAFRKPDDYFDTAPWRQRAGGGPILINLVHELDALRWLCCDIEEVQALASSAARGFEVEDTVGVTLRFRSGAIGTFLLSDAAASARSWELTSREDPAYPHHPDLDCYEVAGSQGSLSVPTLTLRRYDGAPSWWRPLSSSRVTATTADPLARQLTHFLAVTRGDVPPLVSARDAAATLAATLAVTEAARTGCRVRLPDPYSSPDILEA